MATIGAQDVRRLVTSDQQDPTLIVLEGAAHVVPATELDTDRYRGALVITSRESLLEQIAGQEPSDSELELLAANLNTEVDHLGG